MADLVRHPDIVDLAEYAEGVLDASRQSAVDQHVRECADCAATLADLAGLSETLAQSPVPPLPIDVADRLDRVIAAEASARASAPADKPKSTVVPIRPRRRWLAPVLAAAAVLAVIGIAVPALDNVSGGGSDDSSSGAAESGADEAGGGAADRGPGLVPNAQRALPALTRANFGHDVAEVFFSHQREEILPKTEAFGGDESLHDTQVGELCPLPADADLPSGRVFAIKLDGARADLLLQPGETTKATAFTCQGSEARVLARATLKAQ